MARRILQREEVLRAVLASDDESNSELSGNIDDDSVIDQDRATRDADEMLMSDVAAESSETDSSDDGHECKCPDFVWSPAVGYMPILYPFTGACGINVDVKDFTPA